MRKVAIMLCLAGMVSAQQQVETHRIQRRPGGNAAEAAPAKLTEVERKRGLELLSAAANSAAGVENPAMRAFCLYQVAKSYERFNRAKAIELLEQAFTATRAVDDDGELHSRTDLQRSILGALAPLAPERADELLLQADREARAEAFTALLTHYEKTKQTDHALELLYRIAREGAMPYGAAGRLVKSLPAERSSDAAQVFTMALSNFRDHEQQGPMAGDDFAEMVAATWEKVSPSLVNAAIEELLKQATPRSDQRGRFTMAFASDKGQVAFDSPYEFRLFQLLPILRKTDPDRAEELLKSRQQLKATLERYPEGTASMRPPEPEAESEPNADMGATFSVSGTPENIGAQMAAMQEARKIGALADTAPEVALGRAPSVADVRTRATLYEDIARRAMKKNPAAARSALDKLLDTAEKLPPDQSVDVHYNAAELYLKLQETEAAKRAIEKGISAADKAYKVDSDANDPNKAVKGYWPSVEGYRSLVRLAATISRGWAMKLVSEIGDPEARVAAQIALASSLLKVPGGEYRVITAKKGTQEERMGMRQ